MKLCKDCKYFEEASDKEAFCLHPQALKYDDPIYGEHSRETCRSMLAPTLLLLHTIS